MNQRSAAAISLIIFSTLVVSTPDAVTAAEGRFRLAPTFADLNDLGAEGLWGVGAQVGFEWAFSDFWAVVIDGTGSYHFADDEREISAQLVTSTALGLRYNIDIFTYVPWVSVSGVAYLNSPLLENSEQQTAVGARIGFGVDYRIDRNMAVGIFADIHAPFSDLQNYPIYSNVGFNFAWVFRL